jgi:hypothetical protein
MFMDREACRDKGSPGYNHKVCGGCAEQSGMQYVSVNINLITFRRDASHRSAESGIMQLVLLDIVIAFYQQRAVVSSIMTLMCDPMTETRCRIRNMEKQVQKA